MKMRKFTQDDATAMLILSLVFLSCLIFVIVAGVFL
jgi:hypothetical protein